MIDYIEYIPTAERSGFTNRLNQVSNALGVQANWLMTVFYAESKVNPKALNNSSGASGLIQFLPSTAKALGTTTAIIRQSTATKQLDWVYAYFLPYKSKLKTVYDCYFAVFYPAALGKSDGTVIFRTGQTGYTQNKGLDVDGDGSITVGNIKAWFGKYIKSNDSVSSMPFALVPFALLAYGIYKVIK